MHCVLENESKPVSIYKFCKDQEFSEQDFYNHFGSFAALEKEMWSSMVQQTHELISKTEGYDNMPKNEKLLSFYYTFFENLTLNRSYVLVVSSMGKNSWDITDHLKHPIITYFKTLTNDIGGSLSEYLPGDVIGKAGAKGLWIQFMTIFKFWLNDTSKGFEKTDAFIEKSVRLTNDVAHALPVESMIDFGKFIIKEMKK
jgi:hypothetical protein